MATNIDIKIVGSSYRGPPAEDAIRAWLDGTACPPVTLQPDPNNAYDPDAIKIMIGDLHVGFIPRGLCASVHGWLGAGKVAVCRITAPWHVSVELAE